MIIKSLPNSLPIRAWIAVITISVIYFLSAVTSGVLAWVSEDDAQAINMAGSIRMATYRINYLLATDFKEHEFMDIATLKHMTEPELELPEMAVATDLQWRLNHLSAYQSSITNANNQFDTDINKQLQQISIQWTQHLKPALVNKDTQGFYQQSIKFVTDVDNLVTQLQHRNESRQKLQQYIQIISLMLSILIMLAGLWELRHKVLLPVEKLKVANQRFKNGEHDTRVDISGYIEFNELGESFNQMAETIKTYQTSLEDEVAHKTAHLTQANQVLSLLYDFAQSLTTSKVSIYELNRLIADFEKIIPKLKFTLCLQSSNLDNKDSIALHGDRLQEVCSTTNCENCAIKLSKMSKSYVLKNQNQLFGELRVEPKHVYIPIKKDRSEISASNNEKSAELISNLIVQNNDAIVALSNLISTALSIKQHRHQESQIILLEERATMARELHDSLAQSLSYLKIQVSILEKHLLNANIADNNSELCHSISNIKQGLNSAYQHLRDLLITFRLSIDDDGFDVALENSAEEFSKKGGVEITVNNYVNTFNLEASEQVNLLQIIRESLSNICRHSQATQAKILLEYQQNMVVLTIKDNGIGLSHDFDQSQHHGLMIMKERAHSLDGELSITDNVPQGTIIIARFVPRFFKAVSKHLKNESITDSNIV